MGRIKQSSFTQQNATPENCNFCKETNCVAWGDSYFKTIGKRIFVDFRMDCEANQIDCCFGTLKEENDMSDEGNWTDFAININFCPICGRKLDPPI